MAPVQLTRGVLGHSRIILILAVGLALRVCLLASPTLTAALQQRVELATPVTSYPRLREAAVLQRAGIQLAPGTPLHAPPLLLHLFTLIEQLIPQQGVAMVHALLFLLADAGVMLLLASAAAAFASSPFRPTQASVDLQKHVGVIPMHMDKRMNALPVLVAAAYYLHPYTVMTCVAHSTAPLTYAAIAAALLAGLRGRATYAMFALAAGAYLSVYPLVVLTPLLLMLRRTARVSVLRAISVFLLACSGLAVLSYLADAGGSWNWLTRCYAVLLTVSDLTPNLGLFWYFFTEIFLHFQVFFSFVLQFHLLVYQVPLAMLIQHDAMCLFVVQVSLLTVFQPYPGVGDSAFLTALLLTQQHLFPHFRYAFVATGCILAASVLAPVAWHLWMVAGTGNANFFFSIALVYSLAHVWIFVDLAYAYSRQAALQSVFRRKHDDKLEQTMWNAFLGAMDAAGRGAGESASTQ